MNIYGDYGRINSDPIINREVTTERKSQVFQATHNGKGELLPSRLRSFISFSFGGKNIEDFNLIACCDGNTMTRTAYSEFEDLTSDYDIMDGQYYHGTHYKPNTLSLHLVSDDLDQKQLDEFLHWFQGGRTRELILAEHPNRAIMARVAAAPKLDVLPFEKKIKVKLGIQEYETSTTVYKGFIDLELVADMPFWYAKQNFFTRTSTGETLYDQTNIYTNPDILKEVLKISYEDTVPVGDMISVTMHFGAGEYASISGTETAYVLIAGPISIADPTVQPSDWEDEVGYFIYHNPLTDQDEYWKGARTADGENILGRIAGAAIVSEDNDSIEISIAPGNSDFKFFYGGTAPSPTILSFDIDIEPSQNNNGYIDCFYNQYAPLGTKEYSTISIISQHQKDFDITLPNILNSWNKAKKIIDDITVTTYQGDLADTFRDQIKHPAVRAWAIGLINYINTNNEYVGSDGIITSGGKSQMQTLLPKFFINNNQWEDAHFSFNAELGIAEGTFYYWKANNGTVNVVTEALSGAHTNATFAAHTENVGDMLRSSWLIIEDHNEFKDGIVTDWISSSPTNSHYLVHNATKPLKKLKLDYKNMYL